MPILKFAWFSRYSMPNTESNLPMLIASSAFLSGVTRPDVRPVESRHQLKAREDHDRQLGGAVAEIDAGRVEEERRSAPDVGAARQEPVHDRTGRRDGGRDVA